MNGLALSLALTLAPQAEDPAARAELCVAHVEAFIAESERESGRVPGPSWFIRSWWIDKRDEAGEPDAAATARRKALAESVAAREKAEPEVYRAERSACIEEAINAGAVPGMGPA